VPRKQSLEEVDAVTLSGVKRAEKQEGTRSLIASIFVAGYFVILILLISLSAAHKLEGNVSQNYLLAIGSPLGFIIGFYFKSSDTRH
jgi:ABC-type multidrug transport system permease subunit